MALTQVLVSDFTGEPVKDAAQIKLTIGNVVYTADADVAEGIVQQILAQGRKSVKRGRPKK